MSLCKVILEEMRDEDTFELIEAKVIECQRCTKHVALWSGWSNTCVICGAEYNGSGQRLVDNWSYTSEEGDY